MKNKLQFYVFILVIAVLFVLPPMAKAASRPPFAGHWQAIDVDGSDIHLTMAGPSNGPFQIRWRERYFSFCNGEAGIIRGTGTLNEDDANLLEADLHLACFTTGASMDFHLTFRYHPVVNTLSARYENEMVLIWHRPGHAPAPPLALNLRVNYGHDWVESFYEAGHVAWITVTESDGVTVKASAELLTEPKDFWDGESGFTTQPEDWYPAPPDIQPHDWVFGWVDNGASAQVQIGEISGAIDLAADSIQGTIAAPWFSDAVNVECHPWGAPGPAEMKFDAVLPDGVDPYACSWAGEWDIQPDQDVGVGYYGSDGHWVANAFFVRNAAIIASIAGDWFWTTEFKSGTLNLFIYESAAESAALLWQGSREADEAGFVFVGYEDHGLDLVRGNYLVVSDGAVEKGLVLETITMEVFDTENEIMAGTAPAGRTVWANAGEQTFHQTIEVTVDANGAWLADFKSIGFDITEAMRPGSFAHIYDEDGDANEAGTPPPPPAPWLRAHPVWDSVDAWSWPQDAVLHLTIDDPATPAAPDLQMDMPGEVDPDLGSVWFEFGGAYDLKPGDEVTLSDGTTTRHLVVSVLTIDAVDVEAGTAAGTAEAGAGVLLPTPGEALYVTADSNGYWFADFRQVGFDLLPGTMVIAEVYDEDGDLTSFEWYIPDPSINS